MIEWGKGKIQFFKIFDVQTEKFYTRNGREKIIYIIVTISWLTNICDVKKVKTGPLFLFVFGFGFLFIG